MGAAVAMVVQTAEPPGEGSNPAKVINFGEIVPSQPLGVASTAADYSSSVPLPPARPPNSLQPPPDNTVPTLVAALGPPKAQEIEFDGIFEESKCPNMRIGNRSVGSKWKTSQLREGSPT